MRPDIGPVLPGRKAGRDGQPAEFLFRVKRGRTGSLIDIYRYSDRETAERERAKLAEHTA